MRKVLPLVATAAMYLTFPSLALAEANINACGNQNGYFKTLCMLGTDPGNGKNSVGYVLGLAITLMFIIAVIVALFFLVQGGIKWITSQGDTKNVEGARNQIIAAAVGLAFTFLSYLIINLMLQFFLGTNINSITIPTLQ
jgi:hypothetical protein